MPKRDIQFFGIVFFTGMDVLPGDTILNLSEIRKWALDEGLIAEPEFQLLLDERLTSLEGKFTPEDQLQIALAIHPGGGHPFYFEYPYLPIKSLIRRAEEVELYYWRMGPTRWDAKGNILHYGEMKMGFMLPGCTEEMCSLSNAKHVVEKFHSKLMELSNEQQFILEKFSDGTMEITVDGAICAKFLKDGRYFDVLLSRR